MNTSRKKMARPRAFARRFMLVALLCGGMPAASSCTETFPQGDFLNLAAAINLIAAVSVTGIAPADNATDVKLTDDIAVLFNRAMDTSTVSVQTADGTCAGTVQLSADDFATCLGGTINSTNGDATFVFNPTSVLTTSTTYKVKVTTAARDTQGDALAMEYLMANGFTTAVQPAVTSSTPANGNTGIAVNAALQFTFNKAVEPASLVSVASTGNCNGRSVLLSSDSFITCVGGTISTSDNTTFTFTPTNRLAPGTTYAFGVADTVQDSFGNTMAAAFGIGFVTYRPPVTTGGATMQLWLSAGDSVFTDGGVTPATNGDQIQQWNDLSGLNNHAAQATLNQRPRYVQGIQGGQAVMRFDGANDNFDLAISVSPTAISYTIFTLHRVETAGQHALLAQQNGAGTGRIYLAQNNACAGNHRMATNFGGVDSCSSTDVAAGTWYITTVTSDMTNVTFYVNGTADGTVTPTIENATGFWRLGASKTGAFPLDGDIAEVIAYNQVLGATDRQRVECYLANRYGLTITGHTCN